MVFKTIISFICGLYRFYTVLPMGKTDCFTQFYPTGFTHWVKLPCQPCRPGMESILIKQLMFSDSSFGASTLGWVTRRPRTHNKFCHVNSQASISNSQSARPSTTNTNIPQHFPALEKRRKNFPSIPGDREPN